MRVQRARAKKRLSAHLERDKRWDKLAILCDSQKHITNLDVHCKTCLKHFNSSTNQNQRNERAVELLPRRGQAAAVAAKAQGDAVDEPRRLVHDLVQQRRRGGVLCAVQLRHKLSEASQVAPQYPVHTELRQRNREGAKAQREAHAASVRTPAQMPFAAVVIAAPRSCEKRSRSEKSPSSWRAARGGFNVPVSAMIPLSSAMTSGLEGSIQ